MSLVDRADDDHCSADGRHKVVVVQMIMEGIDVVLATIVVVMIVTVGVVLAATDGG